ncbi:toprim domain-containing protein [Schleiferia thermophila]|uniref:Toprim domain-containing protein n=1 Tax=Schleiferia thermophila TaxID=884107 RepID=A0A368ZVK7_9FLAO|nr:toprim domain-containing protein [Schleiferia thermophila]RCX01001.1 Toprim domain-containing protein [Schleiferia thermophila]GCD80901.1 hypothetical protein JCM30197_21480 [Schleiferia thermophila]
MIDKGITGRTGEKAYGVFGKWCICFALKNRENEVTGLYFRSTLNDKESKHFYLKDRKGLYPSYPPKTTKKLILTEAIIDGASLLQVEAIAKEYEILSCYGTNGLTGEHQQAIKELPQLEEIIFFFDNDSAGKEAVKKYGAMLRAEYPKLKITSAEPINKDINETLQGHEESIFIELLNQRTALIFSNEKSVENKITEQPKEPRTSTGNSIDFLKRKHLLKNLNAEIGKAGIVGEENSRMLLFLIIISYLNKNPLHALIQGSSGSGKTRLLKIISYLMPDEDVKRYTRVTDNSFYNQDEYFFVNKLICFEDLDGLKEDAQLAVRELQSNDILRTSTSLKDKNGQITGGERIVRGPIASLACTTRGEIYEDNISRSFLIAVDESKEQTLKIIRYQNEVSAGMIDPQEQKKTSQFIQNCIRLLKPYEVINPYANKIQLPESAHKIRRLNELYQSFVKQITLLNQYQRKQDKQGRLITETADLQTACEILFESIVLKVDELDGSLRQFFERLKSHLKDKEQEFTQRELRQSLNISKAQCSRFFNHLQEMEYITAKYSGNQRKVCYKVDYWNNYAKVRAQIKDDLMNQIEGLDSRTPLKSIIEVSK